MIIRASILRLSEKKKLFTKHVITIFNFLASLVFTTRIVNCKRKLNYLIFKKIKAIHYLYF